MESSEDKLWASKYLLDPLTAPQPHQETGPGSRFNSTTSASKELSQNAYPTPPSSASPRRSTFHPTNPYSSSHRHQAFGAYAEDGSNQKQTVDKETGEVKSTGRRRGSSLGERYPGDMSHRPLDVLRREAKAADRALHLKKKHLPGADLIDSLDRSNVGRAYHHGGPYDATLLARNTSAKISPVAAVKESNAEAIRATPKEHIRDALDKHMPLQGTAVIPPGELDMAGREMTYEEGADLMREEDAPGGAYKRWSGLKYHRDDLKGKGEPSFLLERSLKEHDKDPRSHRRVVSDGSSVYEMQTRSGPATPRERSATRSTGKVAGASPEIDSQAFRVETGVGRSNTTGRRVGEGLKKRFGSLRRKRNPTDV